MRGSAGLSPTLGGWANRNTASPTHPYLVAVLRAQTSTLQHASNTYAAYSHTMSVLSDSAMGLFNHHPSGSSDPPPPDYDYQSELQDQASMVPEKSQAMPQSFQPPTFGCLQLARSDRIRTICLPQEVNGPIEEAIRRVWAPGIQQSGLFEPNSWEWKLTGNPCEMEASYATRAD